MPCSWLSSFHSACWWPCIYFGMCISSHNMLITLWLKQAWVWGTLALQHFRWWEIRKTETRKEQVAGEIEVIAGLVFMGKAANTCVCGVYDHWQMCACFHQQLCIWGNCISGGAAAVSHCLRDPFIKAAHTTRLKDVGSGIQLPREGLAGVRQGIPAKQPSQLC